MPRVRSAALLLFLLILGAASAPGEVWQAAGRNTAMSGMLLGSNLCNFAAKAPDEPDMFSYAGIRAVALIPQADNVTSDLARPSLLWSWGADAPAELSIPLAGSELCPGGELDFFGRSNLSFSGGSLQYRFGNRTLNSGLNASGPNPAPLELNASWLSGEDYSQLYAGLGVRLAGSVQVSYRFRKTEHFYHCETHDKFTACYCDTETTSGTRGYSREMADERNFSVEVGPVSEFWINPPLQKRLNGDETASVLLFARRLPGKIIASADGAELASVTPYSFETLDGPCGEKIVRSVYLPNGTGAAMSRGNETSFPSQLVEKNASYLPFYLEFNWSESAGRKPMLLQYEDWFSNRINFTRNFSVRKPEPYSANGSGNAAMAIRQGDDRTPPAAYPALQHGGALPDVAPLAALLAVPFALGGIGILMWMRKIAS